MTSAQGTMTALLSAVSAVIDLDGCTDRACADRACWLGCLEGDARSVALAVLDELAVDR